MRSLATLFVLGFAATTFAAGPPSSRAWQTNIAYEVEARCTSKTVGMTELGNAYFAAGQSVTLKDRVKTVLDACAAALRDTKTEPYKIIVFLARPTANAPLTTVAHFIYSETELAPGAAALPGLHKVTWIYITADPLDRLVSQIVVLPAENPLWSPYGGVFSAVEKPLEKIARPAAAGARQANGELILRVTPSVDFQAARGFVAETDFVSTPNRDADFNLVDGEKHPTTDLNAATYLQVSGVFSMSNTPKTWLTVNAGVGVLFGPLSGAQRIRVDNKTYTSDPLARGMALAGVTFHAPYDSLAVEPTWEEVFGLFVGGVVSPTGGMAIAGSIGWKGIVVTIGYAGLLVQTAPPGSIAGDTVPAGLNPQLVNGVSWSPYIGGFYAFR